MNQYRGFYKKSIADRIAVLEKDQRIELEYLQGLNKEDAAMMIENAIDVFEVPLGVAPNFLVDDKWVHALLATEESSVVAAASHGAKIISQSGGFKTQIEKRLMRGEVVFANPTNPKQLIAFINQQQETLFKLCDEAYPSIVKRGGGVKDFQLRELKKDQDHFVILDVFMDTQEAMGANMLNTVLEKLANFLEDKTQEPVLMAILSNLVTESLVSARCAIDFKHLKYGLESAKRIQLASSLAAIDPYRCATHNKGVMNGVEAIVLASGNDTRAVSAGVYSYAGLNQGIQPLTTWFIKDEQLIGTITLPLAIGSVGGIMSVHPKVKLAKSIMQYTSVKELMGLIASVGLAQNFAALNALTSDGIQKGHMALHAKNIAKAAGAKEHEIELVSQALQKEKHMNLESAKHILEKLRSQ